MLFYKKYFLYFVVSIFLLTSCTNAFNKKGAFNFDPFSNPYEQIKVEKLSAIKTNLELTVWGADFGEVLRCQCSLQPFGGLDRKLNFIRESKNASALVLSYGNNLFSFDKTVSKKENTEKLSLYGRFMRLSKADAYNLSGGDLKLGLTRLVDWAKKHDIPLVSTNVVHSKIPKRIVLHRNELGKIHVLGLTDHKLVKGFVDPFKAFQKEIKKIPKGELIVLLSDLRLETIDELTQKSSRPFISVGSQAGGDLSQFFAMKESLVGVGAHLGKNVLRLELNYQGFKKWFDRRYAKAHKQRWNEIVLDLKKTSQLSEDELFSLRDLYKVSPDSKGKHNAFVYRSVFLGEKYSKKNELTEGLEKFQKLYRPE